MGQRPVPVTMGSPLFHFVEVEGLLVTHAHFAPRDALPPHYHTRPIVAVMLAGSFDVTFRARTLTCLPGTLHTEPAEERHGNRFGDAGARVLIVQPDPRQLERLRPFRSLLDGIRCTPHSPTTRLAWRLAREVHLVDTAAPLAIEGLTLELLALAARSHGLERSGASPPRWLRRAEEMLHAHFTERLRLADVARAADVHPEHFARVFRTHFGVSVGTYVRGLRLDWAAGRLVDSGEPLADIALRAGFADQSHFTREFKRHTGFTPARYRQAATERKSLGPRTGLP